MILTGSEILKQWKKGHIVIDPFDPAQVGANSYHYRLGQKLVILKDNQTAETMDIPEEGYILEPNRIYLGHTFEKLGSAKYAMSLIGRSSVGRLGLFLTVSADLGHTGSVHQWTLELVCAKPFKIYPMMLVGQISFWVNDGKLNPYTSGYSQYHLPQPSKLMEKL